jgi:hypothetical protein
MMQLLMVKMLPVVQANVIRAMILLPKTPQRDDSIVSDDASSWRLLVFEGAALLPTIALLLHQCIYFLSIS